MRFIELRLVHNGSKIYINASAIVSLQEHSDNDGADYTRVRLSHADHVDVLEQAMDILALLTGGGIDPRRI